MERPDRPLEVDFPVCYLCGKREGEQLVYDSVCNDACHPKCAAEAAVELRKLGVHPGRWAAVTRGEEEP